MEPPIELEKRNQQIFLCNIAKDGISLQKLLRDPTPYRKPQEPKHELKKDGKTQTQARDRGVRNQEKRVQWEKHGVQLENIEATVDGLPWKEGDIKKCSYICLNLGNEGQRRLSQHYPGSKFQDNTARNFWTRLQNPLIKECNITFDRYEALTRKQNKTETLEQVHCGLAEKVERGNFKCPDCQHGGLEAEIIRDLFTATITNDKVQQYILAETKNQEQAFENALRREKGLQI